jgi:hypothetical protein
MRDGGAVLTNPWAVAEKILEVLVLDAEDRAGLKAATA